MCNNNCSNCNCSNNCGEYSNFSVQRLASNVERSTGDSRAIRIGNDIKLDVTIQELTGMDIINIKAIKCFIINTTPMLQDHKGTPYEIRRCGFPGYYAHPYEEYHGFGLYPGLPQNWHYNLRPHYDYLHKYYGHHYLKPIPHNKPFEFIAPVKALEDRNKVRVFFPATAQMLCGLYSLTFVIDLYEPGYHSNNLRTVTVDYNNVFELVPNAEGRSGDIVIDIDKQIGLNVYDSPMFGNANQNNQQETEDDTITSITIDGPSDIRVGKTAVYTVELNENANINNIEWQLVSSGEAELGIAENNMVIVHAKKISDIVSGESDVTLICKSTDGSKILDRKTIKIHNYATDIVYGQYGTYQVDVPYESAKSANFYIIQEDGTKISACERGCDCQGANIRSVNATAGNDYARWFFGKDTQWSDCSWSYDDQHNNVVSSNLDSSTGCSKCSSDSVFTVHNVNRTPNNHSLCITVVGNAKKANGEWIEGNFEFICYGQDSVNTVQEISRQDTYVTEGSYSNGTITLERSNEAGPINIDVQDLINGANDEYWVEYNNDGQFTVNS